MKEALVQYFPSGLKILSCDLQEEVFLYMDVSTAQPTMRVNRLSTHSETVY